MNKLTKTLFFVGLAVVILAIIFSNPAGRSEGRIGQKTEEAIVSTDGWIREKIGAPPKGLGKTEEMAVIIMPGKWSDMIDVSRHSWKLSNTFGNVEIETFNNGTVSSYKLKSDGLYRIDSDKAEKKVEEFSDCQEFRLKSDKQEIAVVERTYRGTRM